ncbi:alpha-(1,3)-fucosyltransferase C-like [Argopecten irradians]|uniref:alpha-(1,3)-fucosyltransferase C-like n=1 Tax=Argopecten irradians TaxID=31199 RepID=UPI003714FC9F
MKTLTRGNIKRTLGLLVCLVLIYTLRTVWTGHSKYRRLKSQTSGFNSPLLGSLTSNTSKTKITSQNQGRSVHVHYYGRPESVSLQAFARCDHKCHMTDGNTIDENADAVIMHGPYMTKDWKVPPKPPGQIWVYQAMEPPIGVEGSLQKWRGMFNWTMTHRRDSDIYSPYGSFMKIPKGHDVKISPTNWESKDRQAAWFVSHCATPGKRELYEKELRKYVDVHIYGGCGSYRCPRSKENSCLKELADHYKYYLAFENSFCDDYVTEKPFKMFWNELHTIPVLRGLSDKYKLFFPPGSYLNTYDFPTIQKLGEEMISISKNRTRFASFFNWRKYYMTEEIDLYYCDLCKRLHYPDKNRRVYHNLEEWVIGHPDKRACQTPGDIL